MSKGFLLVITGPSGSGKDTVMNRLINDLGLKRIVTYTSRPKREGEIEGVDYNFLSKEEFEGKIKKGEFLEHVEYGLHYKGTHKDSIESVLKGERIVWRIDMSRAAVVKELFYEKYKEEKADLIFSKTRVVFIDVPDWKVLEKRVKDRDNVFDLADFRKRLKQDKKVLEKYNFENRVENIQGKLEETIKKVMRVLGLEK